MSISSSIDKQDSSPLHYEGENLEHSVTRVQVCGEGGEFVIMDNKKYYKHELMAAFGGTFNTGLAPPPSHNFANTVPLGLMGFSVSCFILCMFKTEVRGVQIPNIVVGVAVFYGGLVEFLVGCWEIAKGNTFAGTAFASFGPFWMSFGSIYIPWFGMLAAYEDPVELNNAVGFYLLGWNIFIFLCLIVTVRSTWEFFGLFFFLQLTFILLAASSFTGSIPLQKAGGVIGLITGFFGFYNAFSGLADKSNSYIRITPLYLPGALR